VVKVSTIRNFLILLLVCSFSLADVFSPVIVHEIKHVVILCDWDGVPADQMSTVGQFFTALNTVPMKKSFPIIFSRGFQLMKTMFSGNNDGQLLKGLAANLDLLIEQEPSLEPYRHKLMYRLNDAQPRIPMVQYLQTLHTQGIPIIIATNNDYESLMVKSKKLNRYLAHKGISPFTYDGIFCGGSSPQIVGNEAPNGLPAGYVCAGKDSAEYFEKIFAFVETEFGYNRNDTLYVFIDDNKKNIALARTVAQQEQVMLCTVHRNHKDITVIQEMRNALSQFPHSDCSSYKVAIN